MKGFQFVPAEQIVQWTRDFVRHPSEQTGQMEHDPSVHSFVSECVAPLVARLGFAARRDSFGNLLIEAGPAEAPCSLAFFAYAMTHPRSSMPRPFEGELLGSEDTGEIRGRGVSEQKASIAASLAAFTEAALAGGTTGRFAWILLTAGETGRHDAIRTALDTFGLHPKYGIIAIGTDCRISLGNRGRLDVEVTIEGASCHSSTPWRGVDVTRGIADMLRAAQAVNADLGRHPALGPATLTCTAIRTGPEATHTVQSLGRLTFDRRMLPGEDPEVVFASLADSLAVSAPMKGSFARGPFMYGAQIAEDSELVGAIVQAVEESGLPRPDFYYSDAALDAGHLLESGVEAVMWGPGDPDQFHTDEERIPVADLLTMAQSYRAVIDRLAR